MNKYETLNKVVLHTVDLYLERVRQDDMNLPPTLDRLRRGLVTQRMLNKFTPEEAEKVLEIGRDKEFKAIMDRDISFLIFALELMKVWTMSVPKDKRPILGVSDKHFKLGGDSLWQQMLLARSKAPEEYSEKKQVIVDSKEVAQGFFEHQWKELGL